MRAQVQPFFDVASGTFKRFYNFGPKFPADGRQWRSVSEDPRQRAATAIVTTVGLRGLSRTSQGRLLLAQVAGTLRFELRQEAGCGEAGAPV
ncbi:hypothetical protein CDEF62S_00186 [Castellaniella defragrans]